MEICYYNSGTQIRFNQGNNLISMSVSESVYKQESEFNKFCCTFCEGKNVIIGKLVYLYADYRNRSKDWEFDKYKTAFPRSVNGSGVYEYFVYWESSSCRTEINLSLQTSTSCIIHLENQFSVPKCFVIFP